MDVDVKETSAVEAATQGESPAEKSAYEVLKESKASMEEIVAKMLAMKKESQPKSQLRELVTQMFLHFVSLRQANRTILIEEDHVKAETESAKAPVDYTTLQLHNLMYEKSHYLKAIKACKDFKSKYPDIELVPEEEFFRNAPEEFKGPGLNDTPHNLMLKRLNYELCQRKELCKLREKLELCRKGLLETIASRKKFLSSLPSHLKALRKASLPAQNQLGVLHTKKLKQLHSAELLPPPLYIIYSQFTAQKEAFGENIDLEIIGSLKIAQSFAQHQANKDTGVAAEQEHLRVEDDVPDEEDDGQRRRKRPKKVPGKENLDQMGLYQAHPLKIILHMYDDEVAELKPARLITLKFEYLFKLNVVCVGIEGSNEGPESSILCNLFPDDTGLDLPHRSAKLIVGDTVVFDEKRTSRPYKWAQHLAGIDFLPEVSPLLSGGVTPSSENSRSVVLSGLSLYRQQNRVQTVLQRVRSRKKAQTELAEQLDQLMNVKWPSLTCESVPWTTYTPICSFHSWSPKGSSLNPVSPSPRTNVEQEPNSSAVNMDGTTYTSKEVAEGIKEDGELPSLIPAAALVGEVKTMTAAKQGADLKHSKQLTLISKSTISSSMTSRFPSFGRYDEDPELMLDSESEMDDPAKIEQETDQAANSGHVEDNSWVDFGSREFSLVLLRKNDAKEGEELKLEAKIKLSMEYPLRSPLFSVSLRPQSSEEHSSETDCADRYNEIRAMEAEVNLHILKMLPSDQHNYILTHQVRCLAMLFDFYLNEANKPAKARRYSSVVDVGLCKPVSGALTARSFRGRDRRKMISWKDKECSPGYPY